MMYKKRKGWIWLWTLDNKMIIQKVYSRLERWTEALKMVCNTDEGKVHHLGSPNLLCVCGTLAPWGISTCLHAKLSHGNALMALWWLVASVSVQALTVRIDSTVFHHASWCRMYQEWGWLHSVLMYLSFFAPRKALPFLSYCLRHSSMASMAKGSLVWWSHSKTPMGVFSRRILSETEVGKLWPTGQTLPAPCFCKRTLLLAHSHAHSLTYCL